MILVDSCALVGYFRGDDDPIANRFSWVVDQGIPFCIDPHVYQEVLQGARDEREWRKLDAYLSTQTVRRVARGLESHREAARIYYDCRRRGLTVRSLVDCLIAQTALEHDLELLTDDRDYRSIARVRPLRFWAR